MSYLNERMRTTKDFGTDITEVTTAGVILAGDAANKSFLRYTAATRIRSFSGLFNGQELVIANANTVALELTNEDALASANDRIITGSGASVFIQPGALAFLKYDSIAGRARLLAGGGANGFDAGVNAVETLAAGASMTTIGNGFRKYRVIGSAAGENVLSTTPFGATQASEGAAFLIVGTSSANYPVYRPSNNNEGFVGQGDFEATNQAQLLVEYDSVSRRWIEISRMTPVFNF